ncbi:hypothetical protein KFL_001690080 [Klebsormidium nitens]|uniref:Prolyl 4-hydroxylase alpha subunit Fe(2+) 2OG dioxygenase domain-containing protein n=1 Tax=Klebsormidium nitens TaxID=105231 RepID=A0A1Y1HZ32_KLENI|nr:hypothetical protein KFL_001690080 [Klebsormidium nitens]|eukprot:GAQ83930.1 hypothetical protein KFL_001690080 [Klebsormidium nitens]
MRRHPSMAAPEVVKEDYRADLYSALQSEERPGSFAMTGSFKMLHTPGLELPELGPISLPLAPQQAEMMARLCSQAPFGRGEVTVYDSSIRKCLQMSPDEFKLAGPQWDAQIRQLANGAVKQGLGLPKHVKVVPQLYKQLLYEPGCFFTPHRDTEKNDGMFATLVVVLPSAHSGGELIIRHAGKDVVFDSSEETLHNVHYSAFFADCEHEIRPVTEGYRLALIYNLIAQNTAQILAPADNRSAVQNVLDAIQAWGKDADGPEKLVMPLEHQYCTKSLSFQTLKGSDIGTIDIVLQAAIAASGPRFHVYLGMLKKEEVGGGYGDDMDDMEVQDFSLELLHIIAPELGAVAFDRLPIDEEFEVLPEGALEGHEWDDEQIEEATGNEGASMERWYHHAALLLWPHANHWKIACTNSLSTAMKDTGSLAERIEGSPDSEERPDLLLALNALCGAGAKLDLSQTKALAALLVKFGDASMAQILLTKLPVSIAAQVLFPLGGRFGWTALAAAATGVFERACTPFGLADCFNLLLQLAPAIQAPGGIAPNETNRALEGVSVTSGGARSGETCTTGSSGPEGTMAGNDAEGSCGTNAEQGPADDDELERARLCARIIPLLVAKICPPPAAVPARGFYYSDPPLFSLRDTATASAFVRVLERFGADTWRPAAAALVKNQVSSALGSVPGLLSHLVGDNGLDQSEAPGGGSPKAVALARSLADALAPALIAERDPPSVVAHFFATPRLHDVETTLAPALKELAQWLGTPARLETPSFVALSGGCVKALEAKTGTRPAAPRSWALPAACACKCGECRQLVQFCLDPVRTVLQLCVAKPVKKHVQASISKCRLPVHIVGQSFNGGVNVPLICHKNGSQGAADEQALQGSGTKIAEYERDMGALAELRALGGVALQERRTNEPVVANNQGAQTGGKHVHKRARVVIDLGDD